MTLIARQTSAQTTENNLLQSILEKQPDKFGFLFKNPAEYRVQVIYTQLKRKQSGKMRFNDFTWGVDSNKYFYPASTVKLPIAILALQRLNELNIKGLNKNTTMLTGEDGNGQTRVYTDSSSATGKPTIAHYIRKILLVSDNDASNRLYEFLGQEYINKTLHKMGYKGVQILHRLDISLTEEQNRHTNPVNFVDDKGAVVYTKPAEKSQLVYNKRNTKLGKGFFRSGTLVNESFDFSTKNRLPLMDLHQIVRSILFPESVPKKQRFNLTEDDYAFLRKYMSMLPAESSSPVYDASEYWPAYVKFLYYGSEKGELDKHIRIYNKVGDAYGFLIDAMYFADYQNNVEFMLSAVILCNSDGIFNDNKYDYDDVGFPFLKNLGRAIYEYERTIVRKQKQKIPANTINYSK